MTLELANNNQSSIGSPSAASPSGLAGKGVVMVTVAISEFMCFVGKSLLGVAALGGIAVLDAQIDLGIALQKARADLVFSDSMGSQVGSEAFANRYDPALFTNRLSLDVFEFGSVESFVVCNFGVDFGSARTTAPSPKSLFVSMGAVTDEAPLARERAAVEA